MNRKLISVSVSLLIVGSWPLCQAKSQARPEVATQYTLSNKHGGKRRLLKGKIDRQVAFADSLMLKGKYTEAADLYKESLSRNKNNIAAKVGLGMALAKQFKLDAAAEQFDQILRKDPHNAAGLSRQGSS